MEWIFLIVFGGILTAFVAFGFRLHKEDKKILDDVKQKIDEQLPNDESDFVAIEYPYYDHYKSFY